MSAYPTIEIEAHRQRRSATPTCRCHNVTGPTCSISKPYGGDCRGCPAGSPTSLHGGIRIPGCCGWHGSGGGVPVCRRRSDGPIPNMYDPYWAPPEKTLSAWAEGLAALAALALLVMFHLRTRKAAAPASKDRGSGWAAVSGCSSVMSRCMRCGRSGGTERPACPACDIRLGSVTGSPPVAAVMARRWRRARRVDRVRVAAPRRAVSDPAADQDRP